MGRRRSTSGCSPPSRSRGGEGRRSSHAAALGPARVAGEPLPHVRRRGVEPGDARRRPHIHGDESLNAWAHVGTRTVRPPGPRALAASLTATAAGTVPTAPTSCGPSAHLCDSLAGIASRSAGEYHLLAPLAVEIDCAQQRDATRWTSPRERGVLQVGEGRDGARRPRQYALVNPAARVAGDRRRRYLRATRGRRRDGVLRREASLVGAAEVRDAYNGTPTCAVRAVTRAAAARPEPPPAPTK